MGLSASGLIIGSISLGTVVAHAESACEQKTGGNHSSVAYTGKNSGNSKNGYTCAYLAASDSIKLNPWATKSWTTNTALGYYKIHGCSNHGNEVTVTSAYITSSLGSSWTITGTNWNTKTKHFGGGVFWAVDNVPGSQYNTDGGCNYGNYNVNLFWATSLALAVTGIDESTGIATLTATATPDGNAPAAGEVGIYEQLGATQDPQNDPLIGGGELSNGVATVATPALAAGDYNFYAGYAGTSPTDPPPQRGWTGAYSPTIPLNISASSTGAAATATGVAQNGPYIGLAGTSVVNASGRYPRKVKARCPAGQRPIHVQADSPNVALDGDAVKWSKRGARISVKGLRKGNELDLQLLCRTKGKPQTTMGRIGFGTVRADQMSIKKRGTVFAGPGADELVLRGKRATAFGTLGRDLITVRAARAIAAGGHGKDKIISHTKNPHTSTGKRAGSALLIGGPGRDFVLGGFGPDRINLQDGAPGDTVRCRGTRNRVLADVGDAVTGNCRSIHIG